MIIRKRSLREGIDLNFFIRWYNPPCTPFIDPIGDERLPLEVDWWSFFGPGSQDTIPFFKTVVRLT